MKKQKYNKSDFNLSSLPSTRKDQFFDILKHKYKTLLLIGFACFLFLIPMLFVNVSFDVYLAKLSNDPNIVANQQLTEQGATIYRTSIIIYGLVQILTYLIAFIGISGAMRVIRLLSYNEGILFWDDFLIGIKQNFKQFFILSIIFSLGTVSLYLTKAFSIPILTAIAAGLKFVIITPWMINTICYSSTYSLKIGKILKNGFALYVKTFLISIMFSLFVIAYYFISFIPIPLVIYIVKVIIWIFILPMYILVIYLKMLNVYDVNINEIAHPDLIKKGLYVPESKTNDKGI